MNIDKIEIKEFLKGEIEKVNNNSLKMKLRNIIMNYLYENIGNMEVNCLDYAYIRLFRNGKFEHSWTYNPVFWGTETLINRIDLVIDLIIEDLENTEIEKIIYYSLNINLDEYR